MTAIDDTHYVDEETVACDGGGGPLGHPRVWLNMEGQGEIDCPYCGRHFVLSEEGRKAAGDGH
ncbi:zinc-finger domain-containing protein [Fodinicurvata sediminis]|uniref:zinc-finger domain-containing protein n=1 Tax=Fodinicurvata sediminis TaxID=1121832 RepID=UPI00041EAB0C|nr:zinc-finger domain-containing protein [Fodinicurvata sediminis]